MKGTVVKYKTKGGTRYRYVVDIGTGVKRKQKKKSGFLKKKDAEEALHKLLVEVNGETYLEPCQTPFNEFAEQWFYNHYAKRIKATTFASRKYLFIKHLIKDNPFSKKPLSKITVEDIDYLYNLKLDEGYSTSYIKKIHQMLNKAFTQAVKWKKLSHNPVSDADPPSVRTKEINIWSKKEIKKFLEVSRGEKLYILFLLAIYTGMRRGELLGLKWCDIDFKEGYIKVNRTLSYVQNQGYLFTTPKTLQSKRSIPVSELVINELLKHKIEQEKSKKKLRSEYQNQDLVICTDMGKEQDPSNVIRVMKRLIKLSCVSDIRFHDLRHLHASILISEGVDIVKVSARLGHTNPKTTFGIYAHLLPNVDKDVSDVFEKALDNPVTDL